jgi:ADP-ribose pyrophosphatase
MTDAITLFNGRWLRLQKRDKWEYAERTNPGGAAVVLAITPDDKVILIEQFRVPIQSLTIEFPAGLIGDEPDFASENAASTAARELEEETGWLPADVDYVHGGPSSAGMSSEYQHFFRARGLRKTGPGGGTESENITIHEVALSDVPSFLQGKLKAGFAIDPKVYAGLYFLHFDTDGKALAANWWR